MSQVKVQGNASGTGNVTIASPNTNSDRTLTLPNEDGTILSSVSDITTQVKSATNATGSAPIYSPRAWVKFNGTGTPAITASGNVTSITDNGTGDYTINFTTALPDANYVVAGMVNDNLNSAVNVVILNSGLAVPTASACRIGLVNSGSGAIDLSETMVLFVR